MEPTTEPEPAGPIAIVTGYPVVTGIDDLGLGSAVSAIDGTRTLTVERDGTVVLADAHAGTLDVLGEGAHGSATWLPNGAVLVALDGQVLVWDRGELRRSPLDAVMPVPIERVTTGPFARWLEGAGRLMRYADGRAVEIRVPDRTLAAWAPAPNGVLWLATPELIAVDALDPDLPLLQELAGPVVADVAVDSASTVWAVLSEGLLFVQDPGQRAATLELPDAARQVMGRADVPSVWIRTDGDALVHRAGVFSQADVPDGTWLGVDEVGRLLVQDGEQLWRVSVGHPTAFSGLRPGATLSTRQTVGVVPAAGNVERLSAWVDERPLTLVGPPWTVELDPRGLDAGDHALRIVRSEGTGVEVSTLPFRVGDLPDSVWDGDIQDLAAAHCASCHGGASLTRLDSRDAWRLRIDDIIDQVSDGAMPLGGPELSNDDIARIRGWKLGGFR